MTNSTQPYGDALTRPFWAAAAEHRLVMQYCSDCGHFQFYPRPLCLRCGSAYLEWRAVSGRGSIYSACTVYMRFDPAFEPPYIVAMVELEEGPRLLTQIINGEADIGSKVTLEWYEREALPPLPFFRPISQGST